MSIACDCSNNDGDYPEFSKETFPNARKQYICYECRERIKPGKKYHNVTGKWDGVMDTYRTCMACYYIRKHYCPSGYVFGELRHNLNECLGFDYTEVPDEEDDD